MCIYHFLQSWLLFLVKSLSNCYYVYYYYDLYLYHNPKHQPFLYGDGMSHLHWRPPMGYLRSRSEDPRNFPKVKALTTQNLYCRNEKPAWMQYFTTISGKNRTIPHYANNSHDCNPTSYYSFSCVFCTAFGRTMWLGFSC